LVIVPSKYLRRTFVILRGGLSVEQVVNDREMAIIEGLRERGCLYFVPPSCLDDYYWMLASVSDQAASRKGANLDVDPENDDGRWPGTRPMLITNDQMRDHKLELLEPRLFRRWYASHIVNYSFTGFADDQCFDNEIGFSTVDFFSREIQSNPSPSAGNPVGTAWHFPVSDWNGSERFCVRIPKTPSDR